MTRPYRPAPTGRLMARTTEQLARYVRTLLFLIVAMCAIAASAANHLTL